MNSFMVLPPVKAKREARVGQTIKGSPLPYPKP